MVGEIYFTDQTPVLIKCPHYDDDDGDSCDDDDHHDVDDHDENVMQTNAYQLLSPCYKCTITDDDHDNNDNDDDHDNDEMMMHDHDSEDDHHHVDKNFIPTNACQLAPHVL